MGADLGTQHGTGAQKAHHHQKAAQENRHRGPGKVQHHIACHQKQQSGDHRGAEALAVIDLAVQAGKGGRQHNGRGKDQHIIVHAQRFGVIKDQVGHEDLNGNVVGRHRRKGHVQLGISLHYRGPEAIENIGKVILVLLCPDGHIPDQEEAGNTDQDHHHADDVEDGGPAFRQVQIEAHEAAEDHQNGHQGHHGIDALDLAPVGIVGYIRQPGIEAGIIGRGTEEGHDAVHDDGQGHANGCGRGDAGKQSRNHIHAQQGKAPDAQAPGDVAAADENLALAQLVAEGADQQRGHRGGNRRCRHHGGDGRCAGMEHFVDEDVEVHVLHRPCHLARQAEDHQGKPEFSVLFCLFHKKHPLFIYLYGNLPHPREPVKKPQGIRRFPRQKVLIFSKIALLFCRNVL